MYFKGVQKNRKSDSSGPKRFGQPWPEGPAGSGPHIFTNTTVPRFDGTRCWQQHLLVFQAIAKSNGWSPDTAALQLFAHLDGEELQVALLMMETVNYYRQHNTDVYVLLLDASQAFDKVNYVKLFQLLIKRNVNPLIIRCLVYMYTNQYMNIKWNCSMSKYFSTSNGVKQGGVLSPILFGTYIDELLSLLRNSGYGCKVGHLYCGAIGYADDVSFISPSLHALKMMCDISLAFASEFDIKFNPIKCQLLYYGKCKNVSLDFDGVVICASDKATHLGHIIGPNVSESVMLNASATLTRSINFVLHNFSHCSYDVKYALFKSYCTSYYGSSLWDITDKLMSVFYVTWRKAIRKVFRLPYRTHCDLLPVIA